MGAPTVVSKGTVTPPVTSTDAPQNPPARTERPVSAGRQFARDVFAQDPSKNPFDTPKGPSLRTIARDTGNNIVNAPSDFANLVVDVFGPQPNSTNEER